MRKRRIPLKAPQSIGQILPAAIASHPRAKHLLELYRIRRAWPEIVGEELARRTQPMRIRGTVLTVGVESSVWAHHLSMMREQILDVILSRAAGRFTDIRFVNEPIRFLETKPQADTVKARKEGDVQGAADLLTMLNRLRLKALELQSRREKH
ncbi:MAG: DUF721 domain-containing protein [Pseudomonadota bacterium]